MPLVPNRAMVLAAGFGRRMLPLTAEQPKSLIEVAGEAMLDRTLGKLADAGVEKTVVNGHYRANILQAHIERRMTEGKKPEIIYSHEEAILETGGGIVYALPHLGDEPFYVTNSDVVWCDGERPALQRLREHWRGNMKALLLLHPIEQAIGYDGVGDFSLTDEGVVRRGESDPVRPYVFTGVWIAHPSLFDDAPEGAFSSYVMMERLRQSNGELEGVYGLVHDGAWLHIGTPAGLDLAEDYFAEHSLERNAVKA